MSVLSDPLALFLLYGAMLCAGFLLAWLSDNRTLILLGLVGVGHWMIYNAVLAKMGYDVVPMLVGLSCIAATLSAWVGYRTKSRVALVVVGLWISAGLVSTAFYYFRMQVTWLHYLCLNITFASRWFVIGGAGVVELVRGTHPVPVRARPGLFGG